MIQFLIILISLLFLSFSSAVALAQGPNENANPNANAIPERNGDYPDPEHPGVRVRVFVHEAGKPQPPTSSPVLTCTNPDSTAVVDPLSWKLPTGPWTYQLNLSSVP